MSDQAIARGLPLCGCGCGKAPRRRGAAFIRGHAPKKRFKAPCAHCGQPFTLYESLATKQLYCSPRCGYAAKRHLRPWNDLQRRLLRPLAEHPSLSAFARSAGVNAPALTQWFKHEGRTISREVLERLATLLDIPLDKAITEAGGRTADERWRENGLIVAGKLPKGPKSAQHRRAIGDAQRGIPKSADHRTAILAAAKKSGAHRRGLAGLTAWATSETGHIVAALNGRLLHTPQPSPDLIRQWARAVSLETGVSGRRIRAVWERYLRLRKLVNPSGRPVTPGRCQTLTKLMQEEGWPGIPPKPRGFDRRLANALGLRGDSEADHEATRQWRLYHVASCRLHDGNS